MAVLYNISLEGDREKLDNFQGTNQNRVSCLFLSFSAMVFRPLSISLDQIRYRLHKDKGFLYEKQSRGQAV